MNRPVLLSSLWLGCLLSFLQVSSAAIIPVTNLANAGAGSLREAIDLAQTGDTIEIVVEGTIALDSHLFVIDTISIIGPGPDRLTISGQNQTRIFEVPDDAGLTISGMTCENGLGLGSLLPLDAGGAVIVYNYFRAENCVFRYNEAIAGGAVVFVGSGGRSPRGGFVNCSFYQNFATRPSTPLGLLQAGGAVYLDGLDGGDVLVEAINCTISENAAGRSGGGVFLVALNEGTARFSCTHCTIAGNKAGRFGGGIDNSQASPVTVVNSIVSGNLAPLDFEDLYGTVNSLGHNVLGGGLLEFTPEPTDILTLDPMLEPLGDHGSVLLTQAPRCESPAVDNALADSAPALDLRGAARVGLPDIGAHEFAPAIDLQILNLDDEGANSLREAIALACTGDTLSLAGVEGAIHLTRPLAITKSVSVLGNSTSGVILTGDDSTRLIQIEAGAQLYVTDLTFKNGAATSFGGGAFLNKGALTMERCAVIRSQAEAGGAIANYGDQDTARLLLLNCTLSANEATDYAGGAIDNRGFDHAAYARLVNCTISDNEARFQGGGLFNEQTSLSQIEMVNTILAGNRAEAGPDGFGTMQSLGHNLVGQPAGMEWEAETGDLLGRWPGLEFLTTWGGVTPTHRLVSMSPAIDAGDNAVASSLDQRLEPRISNQTVDIGAYEYNPATNLISPSAGVSRLSVFPNPLQGQMHVQLPISYEGEGTCTLIDWAGRQVAQFSLLFQAGQAEDTQLWPRPGFSSGLYLLQVETTQGRFTTKVQLR